MSEGFEGRRRTAAIWRGLLLAGKVILIAGCHSGHRSDVLNSLSSLTQPKTVAREPNHFTAEGSAAITATCGKQSFENARKGLIASQTGLHEDVFALRSRTSYASLAFSLDDALRLEDVLRKELNENQQRTEEWECVRQFEEYLETLTDPMVEQDRLAKDFDAAAFKDSTREAQEEMKREEHNTAPVPSARH